MSEPEQSVPEQATFAAGSLMVSARPNETLATLTEMEFKILRDGEPGKARAGRDLCLGFLASGVIGFIGLIATIDWNAAFCLGRKTPFLWTGALLAIVAGSLCGAVIYHLQCRKDRDNSAYSDLMKVLTDHFSKRRPPTEPGAAGTMTTRSVD
jgi:hypothetical protein